MRTGIPIFLLLLVSACGERDRAGPSWRIELMDPGGRRMAIPELYAVRFTADGEAEVVLADDNDPTLDHLLLPALKTGHYELWVPGCRPLRVDSAPSAPLRLTLGYPVDVTWRQDAHVEDGHKIHVKATWRGAGDHPEALVRTEYPAAAPAPGVRSWAFTGFVKGILIDPSEGTRRLYVPWPGRYRIKWGTAAYQIRESPGNFHGSGTAMWSPDDTVSVEVPADGPAPTVTIPPR